MALSMASWDQLWERSEHLRAHYNSPDDLHRVLCAGGSIQLAVWVASSLRLWILRIPSLTIQRVKNKRGFLSHRATPKKSSFWLWIFSIINQLNIGGLAPWLWKPPFMGINSMLVSSEFWTRASNGELPGELDEPGPTVGIPVPTVASLLTFTVSTCVDFVRSIEVS